MATTRTPKNADETSTTAGLSPAEAEALRDELTATPEVVNESRALSPREKATAALLRDRDHLDGCPSIDDDGREAVALVEAYELVATAPSSALKRQGIQPGDPVVAVRCLRCAGARHLASPADRHLPAGSGRHIAAVLLRQISAGDEGELDTTL